MKMKKTKLEFKFCVLDGDVLIRAIDFVRFLRQAAEDGYLVKGLADLFERELLKAKDTGILDYFKEEIFKTKLKK
jgi:hypothetical protein